jgi:hypothetical protein
VPGASEAIIVVRDAKGEANSAVSRDDFEDDAEDAEARGMGGEPGSLDDADEEDGEEKPPKVVGELGTDMGLFGSGDNALVSDCSRGRERKGRGGERK